MTDNEIIKALECLHKRILQSKCAEEITETAIMGLVNALNLINRQKAEIERLKALTENGASAIDTNNRLVQKFAEIKSEGTLVIGMVIEADVILSAYIYHIRHPACTVSALFKACPHNAELAQIYRHIILL